VTAFLFDCAIRATVVLATALAAVRLLRRNSAATRHAVLSIALIFAALMPALNSLLPPLEVPIPATTGIRPVQIPRTDLSTARSIPNTDTREYFEFNFDSSAANPTVEFTTEGESARVSFADAVPWIWLTGALMCLAFLVVGIIRLAWIACGSDRLEGENWIRVAQSISKDYGLRRPLRLLRSRQQSLLATWGFLRPDIILPAQSTDWAQDRIEIVLSRLDPSKSHKESVPALPRRGNFSMVDGRWSLVIEGTFIS
jgi:beta-lactamase regulating signal transducer with metallopeptidase domain